MIDMEIEDDGWAADLPTVEALATVAAERALAAADGAPVGDIVILLTDDETVRDLNARFRGQDKPTNVLSFPALGRGAGPEDRHLGDLALARGVCVREAAEQGKPLAPHLQHLVAHGVLHLVGYDHQKSAEAEAMEALERRILAGLDVPDPYAAAGARADDG